MKNKNTAPLLSLCIPNYNRPQFLAQNLKVIARQATNQVEIVVSDDCSQEKITPVIDNFAKKYPNVKLQFYPQPKNLGFDKNVLEVISKAKGKFCWLLSNDDQILPGSLNKITQIIKNHPRTSLISINYQRFDQLAQKITAPRMINLSQNQQFTSASKFFFTPTPRSYFKFLGVNMITMSTDIFNRSYWGQAIKRFRLSSYIGFNFIHTFVLTALIKNHPNIYFVASPQVQYLANNHRVWSNDIWKDFNQHLFGFMEKIGYDKQQIDKVRQQQKEYEFRESLTKSSLISKLYQFLVIIYRTLRQSLAKISP